MKRMQILMKGIVACWYVICTMAVANYLHGGWTAILLRRTKTALIDGKPILKLPERRVHITHIDFTEDERNFYDYINAKAQARFSKYLNEGTIMKNYSNVCPKRRSWCETICVIDDSSLLGSGDAFKTSPGLPSSCLNYNKCSSAEQRRQRWRNIQEPRKEYETRNSTPPAYSKSGSWGSRGMCSILK